MRVSLGNFALAHDRSESQTAKMKRQHILPLLGWTALWALFFLTILVGSQRLATSDFTDQFHTFATFQAGEMAQGRLPA